MVSIIIYYKGAYCEFKLIFVHRYIICFYNAASRYIIVKEIKNSDLDWVPNNLF